MTKMAIDQLISKTGSVYKLVVLAAMRARELSEGAAKLIVGPTVQGEKFPAIALEEIRQGKITFKVKEGK